MIGKCFCCQGVVKGASMVGHFQNCAKDGVLVLVTSGEYWLMLRCSSNVRMVDIDATLKDIWLNCCDHLSVIYADSDSTVYQNLGKTIKHEYDMGDTTHSVIKVIDCLVSPTESEVAVIEVVGQNSLPKSDGINSPRFGQCGYEGSVHLEELTKGDIYQKDIIGQPEYYTECEHYQCSPRDIDWRCKGCGRTYRKPYMTRHLKTMCYKGLTLVGFELYLGGRSPNWAVFALPLGCKVKDAFDKMVNMYPGASELKIWNEVVEMQTEIKDIKKDIYLNENEDRKNYGRLTVLNVGTRNENELSSDSLVQPAEPLVEYMTTIYPTGYDESGDENDKCVLSFRV